MSRWIAICACGWFYDTVYAGMPAMVSVTEIGKMRLSTASFFLFLYVMVSWILFNLWKWLRKDFKNLPQLSFKKALSLIFLWGLAFMLVLVMISGARELMTPGAWQKKGLTYKLNENSQTPSSEMPPTNLSSLIEIRYSKLEQLKKELFHFAETHAGRFPASPKEATFSEHLWLSPHLTPYLYIPNKTQNTRYQPFVYEPELYGIERLVLFTTGQIELLPFSTIQELERQPHEK